MLRLVRVGQFKLSKWAKSEYRNQVLYLASDESQWVTGTAMIVDGGITLGANVSALAALPSSLRSAQPPPNVYVGPSFKRW